MSKVSTGFSMSLDGFITGPNEDVSQVFGWMATGDTELKVPMGEGDMTLKISQASADIMQKASQEAGALVAGRHLFDITGGWGGKHPLNVPIVVVTHTVPKEWVKEGSPFTFVTDGVESAIQKAKEIAGDKNVVIASAKILQQCINLGLLDEIHIDLVPYVLGDGVRLFEHLRTLPIQLEIIRVIEGTGVTHLTYRVIK